MNEIQFVHKREPDWQRLHMLTAKADVSPKQLTPDEIKEFVRLYKRVSADLALARTKSTNLELIEFLNDLCGRAYGTIYRPRSRGIRKSLGDGLATIAITFRKHFRFIFASFLIFVASGFFSYGSMQFKPETRPYFISPGDEANFDAWKTGKFDERSFEDSAGMSGFYASNNPRVSLIAGSSAAVTFGVASVYILYMTGAQFGALAHELTGVGHVGHLFISVSPHGVTELSGIFVAGGTGLLMGWTLLFPGRRRRGEALLAAGKDAIVLLATGVLMMYIAAPIEGFFSFNPRVPDTAKIAFASASAVCWFLFWYGFGRDREEAEQESAEALSAYY
ncbi:MAG: stage II sporulation protein M [Fimbriimonadaceae bacterium]|nr:stage II sporulation protein M [Fimbriimonadaceae bacterium]